MKVVKCSDETYAYICRVAADRKTYLADAVDFLVFKQGERIKELEDEREAKNSKSTKGGTKERAGRRDTAAPRWVAGIEGLVED